MRDTATFPNSARENTSKSSRFWSWPRVVIAGFLLLLIGVLSAGSLIYSNWNRSGAIAPGLVVQGEDLGGLTQEEAQSRLDKRFGRLFVNLQTPERVITLSAKQLGAQLLIPEVTQSAYWYGRNESFPVNAWKYWISQKIEQHRVLPVKWNKPRLRQTMLIVADNYKQKARDARLEVTDAGVQIIPEQTGRALNVGQTCADLQKQYFAGKPDIKATIRTIAPRLVAADLNGQDVKLGEYSTTFDSGKEGRTENIRLAVAAINGKVLMPRERFSFNAMTGERTAGKGYRMAKIFVTKPGKDKAETVDGLGGGVCQVSTTLYASVYKTNERTGNRLAIVERNSHSLPVPYARTGEDATVAWPYKDFKFRNTFPHPVYLRAEVKGSRLKISIWGRVPDNAQAVTEASASTPSGGSDAPA